MPKLAIMQESVDRKMDAMLLMLEKMRDPEQCGGKKGEKDDKRSLVSVQPPPNQNPSVHVPLAQLTTLVEDEEDLSNEGESTRLV